MQTNKPNNTLEEIADVIYRGKSFFIAGHQNPDGDSLGSTIAVSSVLRRQGKEVYSYADNAPGDDLLFLPMLDTVNIGKLPPEDLKIETVILLECSDVTRGGNLASVLSKAKTVINLDHHLTSDTYGHYNYINPSASSTAEIIWQLFEIMRIWVNSDEATCLYTGLVTDTARFLHSNTTAESLRVGAGLISCGADIKKLNNILFHTRSYSETKLLGRALEKMQILKDGKLAVIVLTLQEFDLFGAEPSHTQGIVSQPTMIPGVEVSFLIKEEKDKLSVNLRSKGEVDVSQLAAKFGGGGHARAAGFKRSDMTLDELTSKLIKAAEEAIDNAK
ncbi:Exopolyphosphatase-related protein [Elusimicrobium minutum Pei191]|uniref:Exopolyphosphatase-related protein n=1 Tax=Elusimicrobium minutum (strain Pei191) TaxID=445932 RepID=B2KCA3_ELUMP|nr:bifunctional oligoribonuclease/PAP phosphatase NrnA [Elusimicrobium minutum]ACC98230.1 Exopolyphosphatase-related protein [Elusimicrobium minutum Pei191]